MLDIVIGQRKNVPGERELVTRLQGENLSGTLYIGYPIIGSVDEPLMIEALLTCEEHGVVAFAFATAVAQQDLAQIEDRQNDLHAAVHQKLFGYKPLRAGRVLSIPVQVLTICPVLPEALNYGETQVSTPSGLMTHLGDLPPISSEQLRLVNAAIQRIATIKPTNKRISVTKANSRGAILQNIEREIANLDQWQKRAAIESPDGPQRIRGLAGAGKTIVLALKAAYLHARNPQWDIAITFNTRALYQQFKDLVRRFCFEQLSDEPDWSKLKIMHAWGSGRQPGIYSEIAARNGASTRDFQYARQQFSYMTAFEGVCEELLRELKARPAGDVEKVFDAVLIDEAQDLPRAFFELTYLTTRDPKRVVWAYDELQNIGAYSMAPPSELFGSDLNGEPYVPDLAPDESGARRDIILPVCYRNTPWALTTAHAIGFGIYRVGGLVQFFDNPRLWEEVGYSVREGSLELGDQVDLARSSESTPQYFRNLLDPNDAVQCRTFPSIVDQTTWVAQEIKRNLTVDELDPRDILIILANPLSAKTEAARVIEALDAHGLSAHLAGVTASVDSLFQEGSIAISGIYRAKGNEAPMVYILNSEYALNPHMPIKGRNILFTAVTRSRAWVRICGVGTPMDALRTEVDQVRQNDFHLKFRVPTADQLRQMRRIHRDMSRAEIAEVEKVERTLQDVLEKVRRGEISREHLSQEVREGLAALLEARGDNDTV